MTSWRPGQRALVVVAAMAIWIAITAMAVLRHEPWFDEAQAWLLARDVSPWLLWSRLLHYEGSPGLWHGLLWVLNLSHAPYKALGVLSACMGCATAAMLLWRSPFPWPFRILLPFTYYLIFQYSVVARSYVLIPILLFAVAELYWRASEKPRALTGLLCLLAMVSAHGLIISAVLYWSAGLWRRRAETILYVVVIAIGVVSAWPANDSMSIASPNLQLRHMAVVTAISFREAFAGSWLISGMIVLLSLRFLWQGKALVFFAVTTVSLGVFAAVVYGHVWHQGLLFLVWLAAMWIAGKKARFPLEAFGAFALVIFVQFYWSYSALRYDFLQPYSGSKEAAAFLHTLPEGKTVALGFGCIALEPYFSASPFTNYRQAFHDWSSRNTMNADGLAMVASQQPDYVLVSIKRSPDSEQRWVSEVLKSGYVPYVHFPGALFWHSSILEPESYDLYRRVPAI